MIELGKAFKRATFLCVFLILAGGLQAQDMYKWTDENGVVHFSDKKPAGMDVQAQNIPAGPPLQGANPYAQPEENTVSPGQQRREEIASQGQQAREKSAAREAQCAQIRSEINRLEPNRRVFVTNDKGETERMDDVERAGRVAELKSQFARNCD